MRRYKRKQRLTRHHLKNKGNGGGQRLAGYGSNICRDCAGKKIDGTIQELFDGMMGEIPVETTSV